MLNTLNSFSCNLSHGHSDNFKRYNNKSSRYAKSFIRKVPNNWEFNYLKSLLSRSNHMDFKKEGGREREKNLKSDLSSLFSFENKKKSHKIPNLDGIVKSGRKEWNEANLWSLSKFLSFTYRVYFHSHVTHVISGARLRQLSFELSLHKTFKWSIEIKFLSPMLSLLIKARNLRTMFYFC